MILNSCLAKPHQSRYLAPDWTTKPATESDLLEIEAMAKTAFRRESLHTDPQLGSKPGDLRYGSSFRNGLHHPRRRSLKVLDGLRLVAFFIGEEATEQASWRLNAVAPERQDEAIVGAVGWRCWPALKRLVPKKYRPPFRRATVA